MFLADELSVFCEGIVPFIYLLDALCVSLMFFYDVVPMLSIADALASLFSLSSGL